MANGDKRPTQGGDMLSRCPDSHAEIAAKVGVDKSLVTRWRSGVRQPTEAQQAKLEELYGIPRAAWAEAPKVRAKAPASVPPPPPVAATPPSRPDVAGDEAEDRKVDNNSKLQQHIRDGMKELELDTELSGVKRAEALKKLVDAQVALDKSTGENALTMARIVAHPAFKHAVQTITDAIAPFPEALEAATKALRSLGASS